MATQESNTEGAPHIPSLQVLREIVHGNDDRYHFSLDGELSPVVITRVSDGKDSEEGTYYIDGSSGYIGAADVNIEGKTAYVDGFDPAEGRKNEKIQTYALFLAAGIRHEFPRVELVKDEEDTIIWPPELKIH